MHYAVSQRPASGLLANLFEFISLPVPETHTNKVNYLALQLFSTGPVRYMLADVTPPPPPVGKTKCQPFVILKEVRARVRGKNKRSKMKQEEYKEKMITEMFEYRQGGREDKIRVYVG
jgi:hypothetical protein